MTVMFNNAGIRFCYERTEDSYFVINSSDNEEIRSCDPMQVWTYYIQRVDMAVRRRIRSMKPKQMEFEEFRIRSSE